MKTAMQELIDKIKTECSYGKITADQNYILIWAIYMAEGLLEKEKELTCEFAKEYINGVSYDFLKDYYDEKFNYYNQNEI
jgi:hypothetical protein